MRADAHGLRFQGDALAEAGGDVIAEEGFELVLVGRREDQALLGLGEVHDGDPNFAAFGLAVDFFFDDFGDGEGDGAVLQVLAGEILVVVGPLLRHGVAPWIR